MADTIQKKTKKKTHRCRHCLNVLFPSLTRWKSTFDCWVYPHINDQLLGNFERSMIEEARIHYKNNFGYYESKEP